MKLFKKMIIITISIIATLFIAFTIVFWMYNGELFFMSPRYSTMDRFLKANVDELSYVADALIEMDYNTISINKETIGGEDSYSMEVRRENLDKETIPVPGELIIHIEALYESGVRRISAGSYYVIYTMWSTMDESRCISYSINGEKPNGEQLIGVRQLSKDNWYYYVHDYEKAKRLYPERFK